MKTLITIGFIAILSLVSKSQPISSDTVVCIIDTTKSYVKFVANPCANRDPKCRWQISIQGHYYDIERPENKNFACIVFEENESENIHYDYNYPFHFKIQKKIIKDRFNIKTEEWINKQTDLDTLTRRIGYMPRLQRNFIIFKQDFDNAKTDSVTMHRVIVGYCEIQN